MRHAKSLAANAANAAKGAVFFGLSLAGCPAQAAPTILFVTMSGYDSCDPQHSPDTEFMRTEIKHLAESLTQTYGVTTRFIASCFDDGGINVPERLYAESTLTPIPQPFSLDDFITLVQREAQHDAETVVYLFGHSHGGWLALHTVEEAGDALKIAGVTTVDPISYVSCTPLLLIRGTLSRTGGAPYPGCTTAVPDLAADFGSLAARMGWWEHFYQMQDTYLHSDPIDAATYQEQLIIGLTDPAPGDYHIASKRNPSVWTRVEAQIRADAAADAETPKQ